VVIISMLQAKEKNNEFIKIRNNTEELLLTCARKNPDGSRKQKAAELIKEGIDWDLFCVSAMKAQAAVLIYNTLKGLAHYERIPGMIFDRLRSAYLYILPKAARQHMGSLDVLKIFYENDIPAIPLKGAVSSKRIYRDIESRGASADIDILIKWKDRERAHKALTGKGYSFSPPDEIGKWLWQETCSGPGPYIIDIIYDIWRRGINSEAIAGLWDGAGKTSDNGVVYYEFREEEFLIYMAQYLVTADNGYKCLKHVCDINEFLNLHSDKLNWDGIIDKAEKWRLKASLYTAIYLAKSLFNGRVPVSALNAVRPPFFKRILIKTFFNRKVMFRENIRRKIMDRFLRDIFFELIEARSMKEYASILNRVFFPPKEIMGNRNYISRIFQGFLKTFHMIRPAI